MPDLYGPFTAATMGQAPWFRDHGYLEPSGVPGPPAATPAAGELGLTTNGLTLSLALGRAHVRGAYYERTGTAWTYAVPANTNATLARIDRVVLRRDLAAQTVVPVLLQGAAAATPTPPAPTQVENGAWDVPLHRITVPPASGTVLTITDERPWVDPASGQLIGFGGGSAVRPTTGLYDGMRLYEVDTDRWIERRGGVWRLTTPEVLNSVAHTANSVGGPGGWAATSYVWSAGNGAKITVPADGITRDLQMIFRTTVANAEGWARIARTGDATTYWPNTNGLRFTSSGEVTGLVLATELANPGTAARDYFAELRAAVSGAPIFYIPQFQITAS